MMAAKHQIALENLSIEKKWRFAIIEWDVGVKLFGCKNTNIPAETAEEAQAHLGAVIAVAGKG